MAPTTADKGKATKVKKSKKASPEPASPIADDRDDQIAILQEQVRLLTIEIQTLRNHVTIPPNAPPSTPKRKLMKATSVSETPSTPGRASIAGGKGLKDKGCTCKGNCSTKICGCVKKDLFCAPMCKCSDRCQNQDPDEDENDKENENENAQSAKDDEPSSSAMTPPKSKNNTQKKQNNDKNRKRKADQRSRDDDEEDDNQHNENNKSASGVDTSHSSNVSTQTDDEENQFNPMKPRHQLARSPATASKSSKKSPRHPALSEIPLPVPKEEPVELSPPPPEEINEAEVDWEKHKAQLVQCSKCKRSFYPHRLKKHEDACIKI